MEPNQVEKKVELSKATSDDLLHVHTLLNEYYTALDIVKRDTASETEAFLEESMQNETRIGVWLAYDSTSTTTSDKIPIGCVALRLFSQHDLQEAGLEEGMVVGEVKRLFVRDGYRGHKIADRLVDALEDFARSKGVEWMYLDSKDDLLAALALYRRRGYLDCARYNTNPQATIFLRKKL